MKKMTVVCAMVLMTAFASGCAKKGTVDQAQKPAGQPVASGLPAASDAQQEAVNEGSSLSLATASGNLATIFFDFDSHTLSPVSREVLAKNAQWLKANPTVKITIEGHTDERGSDAYNMALGERRARAAMEYLKSLGVAAERLTIISYGEEKPAVIGGDENAWSQNRRAEFL